MTMPDADKMLPLDEVMLAMDVVDTLRHQQDLVARELDGVNREQLLIDKLKDIYSHQGIEVPEHILKEGVKALAESRFAYAPPRGGLAVLLATIYVTRARWGRFVLGAAFAVILAFAGYQFAYLPFMAGQAETARIELSETLPARMDSLYKVIYEETKVQSAVARADDILARGKAAAKDGDRSGAETAIASLENLRDLIRQDYTLRIVNRDGVQSGFWTFPEINRDATNYYIVVEAIGEDGKAMALPIANEETGETEKVTLWGLRVPEGVYRAVEADKSDDGIIQRNIVGRKQYGFVDVDYVVPVLGGAVTRW